jgi:ELWxxDGT repeat protein
LWTSDGTAEGTTLVRDIQPGTGSSTPVNLTDVSGTVVFAATTSSLGQQFGQELWRSDGTEDGTVLTGNIKFGGGSSSPSWLTFASGVLFFTADDGQRGRELWQVIVS